MHSNGSQLIQRYLYAHGRMVTDSTIEYETISVLLFQQQQHYISFQSANPSTIALGRCPTDCSRACQEQAIHQKTEYFLYPSTEQQKEKLQLFYAIHNFFSIFPAGCQRRMTFFKAANIKKPRLLERKVTCSYCLGSLTLLSSPVEISSLQKHT